MQPRQESLEELEARIKEIEKKQEQLRRLNIIVVSKKDLEYKYQDFSPRITKKSVTLTKPLPTAFLSRFKFDCARLGYKPMIDSTGDLLWNADHY